MTDERMDARLRSAGEAWRAADESSSADVTGTDPVPLAEPPAGRHRGHRTVLLASAALVVAALVIGGTFLLRSTGSHRSASTDHAGLFGTVWRLVGYGNQQRRPNSSATFYIGRGGKLVADDSCNLITADAGLGGGRLLVSDLDQRFYNCTDSAGEMTFDQGVKALKAGARWSIDGANLTLTGGGQTLHLVAADHLLPPTADRPTVTGATWRLTAVHDAGGASLGAVPKNVTLTIDHGKLTTSDGCNGIGGRAEVVDGELVAGAWAMTQIGCGNPTTQTVIGRVIANGAKLQVVGPTLTVSRAGVGALTYQWQPQDDQSTDPGRFASTAWRLVSLAGDPAPAGVSIRLTNKTALTLDVGCARYTGTATIGHGALTTTGLPQDVGPGCPPEASTLLSFLTSPPTLWSIQDGKLLVYGGNAQAFSAVFAPEDRNAVAQEPAQAIVGSTWTLTAVEQTSGNSASGHSTTVHVAVRFQAKARITVAERCARLAGPVTLRDHDMDIGRLQPTEVVSCPMIATNLRREEETTLSDVHRVLSGRATWHIHGNQLTLTKAGTTLTFESS